MDEIFQIADRVAVLRDGFLIDDVPIKDLDMNQVVKLMVGRDIELYESSAKSKEYIENLSVKMDVKHLQSSGVFTDISFQLKEGEILGIAGLVGSGRSEVMRSIFGADQYDEGEIYLNGKSVTIDSVEAAIGLGIALLPESRKLQGLILMHNLVDNITLPILKNFISRIGFLIHSDRKKFAETQVVEFDIKPGNVRMVTENLSGGNQQKVCISKWLSTNPEVLIVDEPTVGIDVRTKSEIHKLLRILTERGVSIIMVSSEMQELIAHCDRIMVLNAGKSLGTFYNQDISQEKIMNLIMEDIIQNHEKGISENE
jgi:ABC-type sugar transport system ATPase subunit